MFVNVGVFSLGQKAVQNGACTNIHTFFPPSLVLSWIELGGKPNWPHWISDTVT